MSNESKTKENMKETQNSENQKTKNDSGDRAKQMYKDKWQNDL